MTDIVKKSNGAVQQVQEFTSDQVELIKRTIAKGTTNDELQLFLYQCKRLQLDPFSGQIYAIKRWDSTVGDYKMSIEVGIDGLRSNADRTENYAPGRDTEYAYDAEGNLLSATTYVKKRTTDGEWHEVSATAHWNEYVKKKKGGEVTQMWKQLGHVMLAKCAEALALRRAFPTQLSGVYTREETSWADDDIRPSNETPIEQPSVGETPDRPAERPPKGRKVEQNGRNESQKIIQALRSLYQSGNLTDEQKSDLAQFMQDKHTIDELKQKLDELTGDTTKEPVTDKEQAPEDKPEEKKEEEGIPAREYWFKTMGGKNVLAVAEAVSRLVTKHKLEPFVKEFIRIHNENNDKEIKSVGELNAKDMARFCELVWDEIEKEKSDDRQDAPVFEEAELVDDNEGAVGENDGLDILLK